MFPAMDDKFAKKCNSESMADLKAKIRDSISQVNTSCPTRELVVFNMRVPRM